MHQPVIYSSSPCFTIPFPWEKIKIQWKIDIGDLFFFNFNFRKSFLNVNKDGNVI